MSRKKKYVEPVCFLLIVIIVFGFIASRMGMLNMLNTMFYTAYSLLIDTCFYIMAIAVVLGALSELLAEFGVIGVFNVILAPFMKPLYGLPGASALGIITTYLSDNPAILMLADNNKFKKCFKKYQMPALTNIGTAFGMGLIVTTYMVTLGAHIGVNLLPAALIGNLGAVIGSIISTRIMLFFTKRRFGKTEEAIIEEVEENAEVKPGEKKESLGLRVLNAAIKGGNGGVQIGMSIIAPVLLICTLVLMLTNGSFSGGDYTGAAYEGIGLIPFLADKIDFILRPLFGFASSSGIAVPVTALGSAGAAIALVPQLLQSGAASVHDVAVFTAMCMCWSGYLSTHVMMMKSLNYIELTGRAILSHTVGGFCAGIAANLLFQLFTLI